MLSPCHKNLSQVNNVKMQSSMNMADLIICKTELIIIILLLWLIFRENPIILHVLCYFTLNFFKYFLFCKLNFHKLLGPTSPKMCMVQPSYLIHNKNFRVIIVRSIKLCNFPKQFSLCKINSQRVINTNYLTLTIDSLPAFFAFLRCSMHKHRIAQNASPKFRFNLPGINHTSFLPTSFFY